MEAKRTRKPGAGVKADDGVKDLDRRQISVDPASEAILLKVGDGNFSLGIREAARRLVENKDARPFSSARHAKRQK